MYQRRLGALLEFMIWDTYTGKMTILLSPLSLIYWSGFNVSTSQHVEPVLSCLYRQSTRSVIKDLIYLKDPYPTGLFDLLLYIGETGKTDIFVVLSFTCDVQRQIEPKSKDNKVKEVVFDRHLVTTSISFRTSIRVKSLTVISLTLYPCTTKKRGTKFTSRL